MVEIECPLCGKRTHSRVMFDQTVSSVAAAAPEGRRPHYRIVRCAECGIVYSNPIFPSKEVHTLYREASALVSQPYDLEEENVTCAYARHLRRAAELAPSRERILDIGCGEGFSLGLCLREGFREVYGVEPSAAAYDRAPPDLRRRIRNDVFCSSDYGEETFDVISCFHVLDHVVDPLGFVKGVRRCLKRGGVFLAVTHNIGSWLAAVLGERWDPISTAHLTFFARDTLRKMCEKGGIEVREVFSAANIYSLGHWVLRSPLPGRVKNGAGAVLSALRLSRLRLTLWVGNIGVVAQRPSR